ncbi:NAD-dependent epimerase/dehydratase family protein [Mycobacterium sp. pW049]|uniref:NAD-dependent epimerase/dehydratase family protein n=1 Tax=[Mycobacterium] bulgaricum TaxID=3238985 RepID=UPI00351AE32D
MRIFVTGTAGFIGFHLAQRLLRDGHEVMGYDGMTPYYDINLKRARLKILHNYNFTAVEAMLEDQEALESAVGDFTPSVIVHLAAQAGVRYSLENPGAYISANVVGTYNLLEVARALAPRHFLFASTSSVYGGNQRMPFSESDRTDFPVSLYAATKKSGEAMCHSYSHLFKIPTTCFRFFTVYGPWGRPDMALFKFVERILTDTPIEVYGEGKMRRDFTYIDDLVDGIVRLIDCPPEEGKSIGIDGGVIDSVSPVAPWRAVNIAGGQPVGLLEFIETIEKELGRDAEKVLMPMQKGDVRATFADASLLTALTGAAPAGSIDDGVKAFVDWYRQWRDVGQ